MGYKRKSFNNKQRNLVAQENQFKGGFHGKSTKAMRKYQKDQLAAEIDIGINLNRDYEQ